MGDGGVEIGGKLGVGRSAGFSGGASDIAVIVGNGVLCVAGIVLIAGLLRREPGCGVIGRTAPKYWVGVFSGDAVGLISGVAL